MTETFDVRIDAIAAGGDGVGRRDGLVIFVPRTAPGDVARVRGVKHDRLMRGTVVALTTRSTVRVNPVCVHYVEDRCGGCQLQHLSYTAQLDAKAGIIRDAMLRIGRREIAAPAVDPSDKEWRYRSKLTLALRRRDGGWIAGLHRFDAPDEVFPLRDCPITDERVLEAWRTVLAHAALLPSATELRAGVRLLSTGFSFVVEGAASWPKSGEMFASIPSMSELWWRPAERPRRLLHSRGDGKRAGASFVQVNSGVANRLFKHVLQLSRAARPATAVDAYAGTGDLAVALAQGGTRVTAIEIDRAAARVCEARLPQGSRTIAAAVESALPDALPVDLVVLNPPRAGIHESVAHRLSAQGPKPNTIIYVSCNPATLARDVRRMDAYRIQSLRAFDMFPQTAHVETVCELGPAA